jgi:hypothetical protein
MANRIAILLVCAVALLVGPAATAQADSATQLPFANTSGAWLVVDPSAGHVFVSGGPGNSSIVVLNYAGGVVTTIPNEGGRVRDGAEPDDPHPSTSRSTTRPRSARSTRRP